MRGIMAEIPSLPRHTMVDYGNRIQISIPSQKIWFTLIFLPLWLTGWAFGEISAIHQVMKNGFSVFMMIWLTGWTIGGGFAILMLLWQIAGQEIIQVSGQSIIVTKTIFNLGFPKEYNAGYVKDLRISISITNENSQWGRNNSTNYLVGYPKLAFDYGAKTIQFGNGIDEAEAKQILYIIQQRYQQYKKE